MKKNSPKKSKFEELDSQSQQLQKRLLQAYSAGMSQGIIDQIQSLIEQNQLNLHDERTLEVHRAQQKNESNDGYIV
jgi:tRNA A37 N6-isopentenylltransferase MiaA